MRKFVFALVTIMPLVLGAQVKIGVNANSVNNAAILELSDTARGFLPPRMTSVQLGKISNPPVGLLVYVTDFGLGVPGFYYNASSIPAIPNYKQLITADAQYWNRNSFDNSLYYTAGNVGIGGSSPAARLHISDNDSAVAMLQNTLPLSNTSTVDLTFKNGSYYTGLIRSRGTGSNFSSLSFYTNATTSLYGLQERLTITDNGNVGIGNSLPTTKLEVGGSVKINGILVTTGSASIAGNADISGTLGTTGTATIGGNLSTLGTFTTGLSASVGGTIQVKGGTPLAGKVLTATNSSGNATWQTPAPVNTGFLTGLTGNMSLALGSFATINFVTGATSTFTGFDDGNNFNNTTHQFTAPSTGFYHFDISLENNPHQLGANGGSIYIKPLLNGTPDLLPGYKAQWIGSSELPAIFPLSFNCRLTAGDVINVRFFNETSGFINIYQSPATYFSGYRVY